MTTRSARLAILLLMSAGCQSRQIDLTGPDELPGELVSYAAQIDPLLTASCSGVGCHAAEGSSGVRVGSHALLLASIGQQYGGAVIVPGDAEQSPLTDKLGPVPRFGLRMPLGAAPLSAFEITQITAWIDQGALDN